jgi:hypothetical protein
MQKIYKLQYDLTQAGDGAGQYTQQEVGRLRTLLQGEIGGLQQYVGQQIAALGKSQKDNSGLAQEVASLAKRVSALEQHSSGGGGGGAMQQQGRTMLVGLGNGTAVATIYLSFLPSRIVTSPACQTRIMGLQAQLTLRGGRTGQMVNWTAYR